MQIRILLPQSHDFQANCNLVYRQAARCQKFNRGRLELLEDLEGATNHGHSHYQTRSESRCVTLKRLLSQRLPDAFSLYLACTNVATESIRYLNSNHNVIGMSLLT